MGTRGGRRTKWNKQGVAQLKMYHVCGDTFISACLYRCLECPLGLFGWTNDVGGGGSRSTTSRGNALLPTLTSHIGCLIPTFFVPCEIFPGDQTGATESGKQGGQQLLKCILHPRGWGHGMRGHFHGGAKFRQTCRGGHRYVTLCVCMIFLNVFVYEHVNECVQCIWEMVVLWELTTWV